MKKIFRLIMLVVLSMVMCGCSGTSEPEPSLSDDVNQSENSSTEPSSISEYGNYPYNAYADEEYKLVMRYPDIFDSEQKLDENGKLTVTSTTNSAALNYWTIENVNNENADDLLVNMAPVKGAALGDKEVIGIKEDTNPETGASAPSAFYWLVRPDYILTVQIKCVDDEEAEKWYSAFKTDAIAVEEDAWFLMNDSDENSDE
ncbi:hypothetical protein Desor_2293 [Desulfosporosinus orientis DSM 765]|uniref:Uncharacterized protein n=1 Tax=Desulfosporosinus orientis (strain ATCC 19365 / DSM 765 / NCIMB 8382 / VKM B-1628 / Singapore I) TaxID=768706 RepID=G7WBA8_DESOD|nr:hypothetical protein [Desulfosporosinus orientis]AET67889.1 hypothetical protein Desor_2293 [Desulfosporosinus orientis DSM 765]